MNDLNRDTAVDEMFFSAIWSFISGLLIVSTISFVSAAFISNFVMRAEHTS